MIVSCDQCGKRYRVDISKIYGDERSFACRGCKTVISVQKPVAEATKPAAPAQDNLDDLFGATTADESFVDASVSAETVESKDEFSFDDLNDLVDMPTAEKAEEDSAADFILGGAVEDDSLDFGSINTDEVSDDLLSDAVTDAADEEDEEAFSPEPAATPAVAVDEAAKKSGFLDFWHRLTGKVILAMFSVAIIPLIGFGLTSYFMSQANLKQSSQQVINQTAVGLKTQVEEWVDKNLKVLQAMANMEDMLSMDPDAQERILKSVSKAYPWMYLAFTLDVDGINIARSDDKQPINYSHRRYYWDIVDGKSFAWQTLIEASSGEPALILAVPLRENGQLVGVMAAAMRIDDIAQWVATWKEGQTGYAALIEKNGKVIVHPNKDYSQLQYNLAGGGHPLAIGFKAGETGGKEYVRDGVKYYGTIVPTQQGWGLLVEQQSDEVYSLLRRIQPLFLGALAVAALLAVLAGIIFARGIVKPILKLSDAADRLSLGELDVVIDVSSKDEIGQLAKSITRMQDSLRIALEWLRSMK
jgi:methyl-accepting chemotaxis protein